MTRPTNYWMLGAFGLLSLIVSAMGGAISDEGASNWYPGLIKPFFAPQDWGFGPVWTALFAAMAVAAWWVWRQGPSPAVSRALAFYGFQLLLYLAWSTLFFALQAPAPAFMQLIVLSLAVAVTIHTFRQIDLWAARLMLPYLAWVIYLGLLNAAIWWLN